VTIGDVVRVALLFYTMPAWAVLLAWLILGERPQGSRVLQLMLALAGVAVVLKKPDMPWPVPESLADYLALMGGFSFALTNVMLRKAGDTPSTARMLAMFGGGAGISLTAALVGAWMGQVPTPPAPDWPWVLWAASLSLGFLGGNLALQYGATRLSAITCSLIMLSEVLFASVSSMLMGAATADVRTWIGGGMILLAALLASRSDDPN
jgi:drug/metabolite transporter (DMT)-like permease